MSTIATRIASATCPRRIAEFSRECHLPGRCRANAEYAAQGLDTVAKARKLRRAGAERRAVATHDLDHNVIVLPAASHALGLGALARREVEGFESKAEERRLEGVRQQVRQVARFVAKWQAGPLLVAPGCTDDCRRRGQLVHVGRKK